ncbi:MAG: hypothetical protein RSN88_01470, partial [Gordonibacter sp.]
LVGVRVETPKSGARISCDVVTPLVGVRVETYSECKGAFSTRVTPLVGVRVETTFADCTGLECTIQSRPSWACGLKHDNTAEETA